MDKGEFALDRISFFLIFLQHLKSTLFPYTTLFRSLFQDLCSFQRSELFERVVIQAHHRCLGYRCTFELACRVVPLVTQHHRPLRLPSLTRQPHVSELQSLAELGME